MAPRQPTCQGSLNFNPDELLKKWETGELSAPQNNDLSSAIKRCFTLKAADTYVYIAIAQVTLAQVQQAINAGGQHGLHAWYITEDKQQIDPPPLADIEAYTSIFSSTTSTSKALTALKSNAKKDSIRANVATNLIAQRLFPSTITIPKLKKEFPNPYFDFWAWSCKTLEWAGPDASTVNVHQSHHVLPIFYHHFGCVCPSYESLEVIKQMAKGRVIADLGSGNGYWTYMLRRMGLTVQAVDNGDSLWRTMWIGDTVKVDGAKWLSEHGNGKDVVLLLVYPQVSTPFTQTVLKAYQGSTIVVAGTQNKNGFTAFKDETVDHWMVKERPEFHKVIQTPLPSFAAKDEALFVFERVHD